MNLATSSYCKHIFLFVFSFLAAFTITIVLSTALRVAYLEKIRKSENDYYDSEFNENDYLEAQSRFVGENSNNIHGIKKKIEKINKEQYVFNEHKFGLSHEAYTFILVIQVHEDSAILKLLIQSLKLLTGNSYCILIFCHNYYDPNINKMIHEIDFAKYLQVYYPYSSQVYPNKFPGNDQRFCSGDFDCKDFRIEPEENGRDSFLAQKKHFWWWHMNYVFDKLEVTKHFHSDIIFLQDNQYVLKDLLFMYKVLTNVRSSECPQCELISFGAHAPDLAHFHTHCKVFIELWDPSQPNVGFAFNRTIWNRIKKHSRHFCYFNDYRWEASLNYLASKRPEGPFLMLSSLGARVLSVDPCDGTVPGCTLQKSYEDVQRFPKKVYRYLYPRELYISIFNKTVGSITAAGEWKDVRDTGLCTYFSESV